MSEGNAQDADTQATEGTQVPAETTWEQACEMAKSTYFIIKNTIDHKEEPLEQMGELSEFLEKVIEDPTLVDKDKAFKDFFYQDLTIGLLKRLNKERSADPAVSILTLTYLNLHPSYI